MLVVGWLLVLATVYVFPDLVYERHQLNDRSDAALRRIWDGSLLRDGWRLTVLIIDSDDPLIRQVQLLRIRLPDAHSCMINGISGAGGGVRQQL